MSKAAYEAKLAAIEQLRHQMDESALRKALKEKNNYLAGRAAAIVGDLRLTAFIPDLLAAFDRFFEKPAETDKQCWAKNAIAKALRELEHRDPAPFLRGLKHVQLEPVWGGQSDSAAPLRGTCALALLTTDLLKYELLTEVLPLLRDPEKTVRVDAVRTLGGLGSQEGALLLRLLALCGDPEPEVTGECFAALLALQRASAVPFIKGYLNDETLGPEAAAALAVSREPAALEALKNQWDGRLSKETRRTMVLSLAGSPLPESAGFLKEIAAGHSAEMAGYARQALKDSRFTERD